MRRVLSAVIAFEVLPPPQAPTPVAQSFPVTEMSTVPPVMLFAEPYLADNP